MTKKRPVEVMVENVCLKCGKALMREYVPPTASISAGVIVRSVSVCCEAPVAMVVVPYIEGVAQFEITFRKTEKPEAKP